MRKHLPAVAALASTLALAAPTVAAAAPAPASARLHGWAELAPLGRVPDPTQLLTLGVAARGGRGHATIQHVFDRGTDRQFTVRVEVRVDCLTETAGTVVLTGTADSTTFTTGPALDPVPPLPGTWHPEVAFTFRPDGGDGFRIAWSGIPRAVDGPPVATACQAPADPGPELGTVRGRFTHRG
ncbi:hypothetical protein ACFVFS_01990 [Kitasatospora sp. NPDC057692]|uniref:hypothetical protein n=1 Tax=Kitasatospora sp. NPDC057692 TaxID=3346215 RepID=UPI00369B0CF8